MNNNMDDKDLFSYDNSNNIVDQGQTSFDLNSFSSKATVSKDSAESDKKKPKKK